MERRNRALKALSELNYIDSLDDSIQKADALVKWHNDYLFQNDITNFDLEVGDLERLSELIFKNINFLKSYRHETRIELMKTQKLKEFVKNK